MSYELVGLFKARNLHVIDSPFVDLVQNDNRISIHNVVKDVNEIKFVYTNSYWKVDDDISSVASSLSGLSLDEETIAAKHIFISVSLRKSNQTYCYHCDQSNEAKLISWDGFKSCIADCKADDADYLNFMITLNSSKSFKLQTMSQTINLEFEEV
jgi:hypothetical protein